MKVRAPVLLYAAAGLLFVLHQDAWLWGDAGLVLGVVPIGLLYHILFCVAASFLMLALTRLAWPDHLDAEAERSGDGGGHPWR
jgi:hypothetical protein